MPVVKVLRFFCVWDDRVSLLGDRRPYRLHYFLEDDTVEVLEVQCAYRLQLTQKFITVRRQRGQDALALEASLHRICRYTRPTLDETPSQCSCDEASCPRSALAPTPPQRDRIPDVLILWCLTSLEGEGEGMAALM